MPIQKQILGEEGGHNHSAAIMHEPRRIEFPHGCVHDGIARQAFLPSCQMLLIVLPFDLVELLLEGLALQHFGVVVRDVHVEVPPMEFIDEVVLHSQLIEHRMVGLPDRYRGEVQVGRQSRRGDDRRVSLFVVVFEFRYLFEDLEGIGTASVHPDLLIFVVETIQLTAVDVLIDLLEFGLSRKMLFLEDEGVRLADLQIAKTVVFERCKNEVGFLRLGRDVSTVEDAIERIVLRPTHLDAFLLAPLLNFEVSAFGEGRVVVVVVNGVDFDLFVDCLQNLQVFPLEEVKSALECLDLFSKFL